MNIHFKDKRLFEKLQKATLAQIEVGAPLYGLQDENSDTDILCVYFPFRNQTFSFVQTHHQLQFKDPETNTDYLFADVFSFVRNALSGDSTLNVEAMHSELLTETPLHFLYTNRHSFYNYPIIKAYLGFASRDLRHYWQQPTEREAVKKYMHAERSYLFAQQIVTGELLLNDPVLLQKKILFSTFAIQERKDYLEQLQTEIAAFRKGITKAVEMKTLIRYMLPACQKKIDQGLATLSQTPYYQYAFAGSMNLDLFYNVNENGILYE